ncbi:MAG TPA: CehA/McbA family metallohydrolase, partial [Spongiibacteraceae bacterium]|nr:CehA/McbA family metallohydrolase [Spongiibacteraceae bacterium]
MRGLHAIGGNGDWALGNGVLCATISDVNHETYLSARGGVLIDVGHCGRADDLWNAVHPLFNMSKDQIMNFDKITAAHDTNSASIIVTGTTNGVTIRSVYRVDIDKPTLLKIDTTLTREQKNSTRLFLFGLLNLHPNRTLSPFSLSLTDSKYNTGFAHPPLDTGNIRSVISAMQPSEWQILVGSPNTAPISYGWNISKAEFIDAKGKKQPLPLFAFNSQDITMFGAFSNPLLFASDKPGLLEFTQTLWMDLALGEALHIEQQILLGERADVANITDQLYDGNWLHGRVDESAVTVHIDDATGNPLTAVVPDVDGTFAVRLPAGTAKVRLRVAGDGIALSEHTFNIDGKLTDIGTLKVIPPTTIVVPRGAPILLVFKGIDGTRDPVLFDDGRNFKVGGNYFYSGMSSNKVALGGIDDDIRHLSLMPGHYRVLATRGPFYSVTEATLDAISGAVQFLSIDPPQRVVDSTGWLGADFHVHSGYSFDSDLPPQQRLLQFAAQGAEVMVPAEHNRPIDYQPWLEALGLQQRIAVIGGSELTGLAHTPNAPRTMGHANIFPVQTRSEEFLGGALPHENRTLGDVIGAYKKAGSSTFFQLNHPRSGDRDADMAYFNHLDSGEFAFDPLQTLDHMHNSALLKHRPSGYRDIDFDGMELLNGSALDVYANVRADWFALLRQGFIKIGTANSDAHTAADLVAWPRNLVQFSSTDLAHFDSNAFVAAVKAGKLIGSTGPLLEMKLLDMQLHETGLGEIFHGDHGTLRVHVEAAPWVAVDSLSIYVNGKLLQTVPINGGETREFAMTFNGSSFVTAEVHGVPTAQYHDIAPGFTPMAFTN